MKDNSPAFRESVLRFVWEDILPHTLPLPVTIPHLGYEVGDTSQTGKKRFLRVLPSALFFVLKFSKEARNIWIFAAPSTLRGGKAKSRILALFSAWFLSRQIMFTAPSTLKSPCNAALFMKSFCFPETTTFATIVLN